MIAKIFVRTAINLVLALLCYEFLKELATKVFIIALKIVVTETLARKNELKRNAQRVRQKRKELLSRMTS